jgi:hypothetical protein
MVVSHDTARQLAEVFFTYVKEREVPLMLGDLENIRGNGSYRATVALLREILLVEGAKPEMAVDGRLQFTPSPQVWSYLTWLSRNTMLGETEQQVAEYLLVQRLSEMRQENYRAECLPRPSAITADSLSHASTSDQQPPDA